MRRARRWRCQLKARQYAATGCQTAAVLAGDHAKGATGATLAELLDRVPISELVGALGGPALRNGRCRAWYRGGENPTSLSIDEQRGCWYDNGAGRGGGKLDLIQAVLGCDRRSAVQWLADYCGVALRRGSRHELRRFAARRSTAERRAHDLTRWRADRLASLRAARDCRWRCYRLVERWRRLHAGQRPGDWRWPASLCFACDRAIGDAYAAELTRIERMEPLELAAERARQEGRRVG